MTFDFLGKIFKKKEKTDDTEIQEMNLEEISNAINQKSNELLRDFEKDVKEKYSRIGAATINLKNELNALHKSVVNTQVDPQLLQVVLSHRNNFINKMQNAIKALEIPEKINFETSLNFYNVSSEALDYAGSKSIADYGHAKILFEKQLSDVIEKIKVLNLLLKDLRHPIETNMSSYEDMKFSTATLEELKNVIDSLGRNKKHLEELENELGNLNREKETAEKDIEDMNKSDEWKKFNELKDKKNELENKIGATESEIIRIISPLGKSLKKFKNLVDNGIEKFEDSDYIEAYINSILEAIEKDDDLSIFYSILKTVKKLIERGKIGLKSEKEEKTVVLIDEILGNKILEDALHKLGNLRDEKGGISDELKTYELKDKKNRFEKDLEHLKDKIGKREIEIKKLKNWIEGMENVINDKKTLLKNKLESLMEKKIEINLGTDRICENSKKP